MDFFIIDYKDPMTGIIIFVGLVFIVAFANFIWKIFSQKRQKQDFDSFVKKFETSADLPAVAKSLSVNELKFLAAVFIKSGEADKAVAVYLLLLEKCAKSEQKEVYYELSRAYFKAGFLRKSEEVLLSCLKFSPRNKEALSFLKTIYLQLKLYQNALETLEALFELGLEIEEEKAYIQMLLIKNNANLSFDEKKEQSVNLACDKPLLQRFVAENYELDLPTKLEEVIDVLYQRAKPVFLQNEEYFEFFYALKLCQNQKAPPFKNPKFQMLSILRHNDFKANLSFSYVCKHCHNDVPLFFYHCPICYKFGTCKIEYEVRADEKN